MSLVETDIATKELRCEKFGMSLTPVAQAAHIADATDTSATDQSGPINAILVVLENLGLVASS